MSAATVSEAVKSYYEKCYSPSKNILSPVQAITNFYQIFRPLKPPEPPQCAAKDQLTVVSILERHYRANFLLTLLITAAKRVKLAC